MPSRPQLYTQFSDIAKMLDQCLIAGGGSFTAPTYSHAVAFRQRCYTFMKKYREADSEASPYDALVIKALPAKSLVPNPEQPIAVRIETRGLPGTFVPDKPVDEPSDDLLDAAAALRDKLGL
jgi:hypothetical protein